MNPLIRLRNELAVFSLHRGTRRARIAYFATGIEAIKAIEALEGHNGHTPHGRARTLSALAAYESTMADLVTQCRWNATNDQTHAAEHHDTAVLLGLIASTEVAADSYDRAHGPHSWEQAFGVVLDDLAGGTDPGIRAEVMTRLYIAARPVIGNNVAETITCLRDSYVRIALAPAPDLETEPKR